MLVGAIDQSWSIKYLFYYSYGCIWKLENLIQYLCCPIGRSFRLFKSTVIVVQDMLGLKTRYDCVLICSFTQFWKNPKTSSTGQDLCSFRSPGCVSGCNSLFPYELRQKQTTETTQKKTLSNSSPNSFSIRKNYFRYFISLESNSNQ